MRTGLLLAGILVGCSLARAGEGEATVAERALLQLEVRAYPHCPCQAYLTIRAVGRPGQHTLIRALPCSEVVTLRPGRYLLYAECPGLPSQERGFDLAPGGVSRVHVWLVPAALQGWLTVSGVVMLLLLVAVALGGFYGLALPLPDPGEPGALSARAWLASLRGEPVSPWRWGGAAAVWLGVTLIIWVWSPAFPLPLALGGLLSALLACILTSSLYAVWCLQRPGMGWRLGVALAGGALDGWVWSLLDGRAADALLLLLHALLLVFWGWGVGALLAMMVRQAYQVFNLAVVVAVADLYAVFWGPAGQWAADSTPLTVALGLPYPVPGSNLVHAGVGVGDLLMMALFLGVSVRLGLAWQRTLIALWVGAILGLLAAAWSVMAWGVGLPALPFLSTAFLLAHGRRLRPTGAAARSTLWALVGLLLLLALLALLQAGLAAGRS